LIGEIFAFVLGITALAAAVGIAMLIPATAGAVGASILGVSGMGTIAIAFVKSTRVNGNADKVEEK